MNGSGSISVLRAQDPLTLVIFGATGDLTHRKLMPSLFGLYRQRLLPDHFAIIGFARREYTDESFRAWMAASVKKFGHGTIEDQALSDFLSNVFYQRGDIEEDPGAFEALAARLRSTPRFPANHLHYLSVKPDQFGLIVEKLSAAHLIRPPTDPTAWTRVVIEKPFGVDQQSARALNRTCLAHLDESQICRIDHYLGKETVQNVLSFRFANTIFEPVFNHRYVDHIQITAAETIGMEQGRGAFYNEAGALRDMVQNHLLQIMALVMMEPPARLAADSVRNEKLKVLQSIMPFSPDSVGGQVVRAQYTAGRVGDVEVPGFVQEDRVPLQSKTETFVAMRLDVRNWRWSGVPVYLRTGKRLARRMTEVVIQFRVPPLQLFQTVECEGDFCDIVRARPNRLIFRIQPQEGISLRFSAKRPAMQLNVEAVDMDFSYASKWPSKLPEAYERLLLDAARGDSTLFTRSDEVDAAWAVVAPIQKAWDLGVESPLYPYEAGSWGPNAADAILANYETEWHNPAP